MFTTQSESALSVILRSLAMAMKPLHFYAPMSTTGIATREPCKLEIGDVLNAEHLRTWCATAGTAAWNGRIMGGCATGFLSRVDATSKIGERCAQAQMEFLDVDHWSMAGAGILYARCFGTISACPAESSEPQSTATEHARFVDFDAAESSEHCYQSMLILVGQLALP